MAAGPLEGVLVVALEQAVAAPLATCRMADAGARVIKIERAEGDFARDYDRAGKGVSSYFAWLNRGKESLVLDVKADADRALLDALLARADVFVQNLAPGATDRLGLGAADLSARLPRLITVDISSYGPEGPFRTRKGYDLLIQAESGLASVTGSPDAPGRIGVSVCDIATGMNAYAAALEALLTRARTGRGANLHVSLFDAAAEWMAVPLMQYEASGMIPPRVGLHHVSIAPYGAYTCKGGEEVVIAIQNEREWAAFCAAVLHGPELATDARFADNSARVAHRPALNEIILRVFGALSRAAVLNRLNAAGIAYGAINTTVDLASHPHLRRVTVAAPDGPVEMPAPAVRIAGVQPIYGPVPSLGAQTAALRAEFAQGGRMKQLVIYRLNPANEAPFHELFRAVTKRVMLRLGFRIDGIWSAERRPLGDVTLCEVVYLLTWPDLETMERAWDALNADSEILERRAAIRERHGASVTEITNRLLTATDYSPDPN